MAHLDRIDAIVMCCDGDGYFTHASCAHEMAALWTFLTDKLCNRATPLIHGTQTGSKGKCDLEQILAPGVFAATSQHVEGCQTMALVFTGRD